MLHLRRLARHVGQGDLTGAELMQLAREPYHVPEATPLHTQLCKFKQEKRRIETLKVGENAVKHCRITLAAAAA